MKVSPLIHLAIILVSLFAQMNAKADEVNDEQAVIVALAVWDTHNELPSLIITVKDQLSKKQKNIITGGFTTLTQMNLSHYVPDTKLSDLEVLYSLSCSVKYDAWEEFYDVATVSDPPTVATYKSFDEYSDVCLKINITDPELLKELQSQGGTLLANLVIKQTSIKEANAIKNELIRNQSGIMQQLFAHMLGELVLSQTKEVKISVPPFPQVEVFKPQIQKKKAAITIPKASLVNKG